MKQLGTALALVTLFLGSSRQLAGQDQGFGAYLAQRYASLGKLAAASFLADAQRDGLIHSVADKIAAKRAFRLATERRLGPGLRGRRGNAFNSPPPPARLVPPHPASAVLAPESEWNDSPGWADDLTGTGGASGSMSSSDDRDYFRLVLASDSLIALAVAPGATLQPVDDPDLEVFDANGFSVAYDDDAIGLYPALVVVLGAGTYYVAVGCPYATTYGSYALSLSISVATIPTLATNSQQGGTLSGAFDPSYLLVLASDSRVNASVVGPLGSDMYFELRGSGGHSIKLCDDTSIGLDPALDTNLPAGTYFVSFGEWRNATGSFTFRFQITPTAIPALSCSAPGGARIAGDEDFDLYTIVNVKPQRIALATTGASPTPIQDTVMRLFDAQMRLIAANDEASSSLSWSLIDTPLPPGVYYVSVQGYNGDLGDYVVSAGCWPAAGATPVAWGKTATSLTVPAQARAYSFQVGTAGPIEVRIDTTQGTLNDPQVSIIGSNGLCYGFSEDVFGTLDSATANALAEGNYWVLVREWSNGTGTFDLHVRPPLRFEDAVAKRTLVTLAKSGSTSYAFVALNALPTPLPLPLPFIGKLLVDLSVYAQLGPIACPAAGTFAWTQSLQPYAGIVVQAISIGGAPAVGMLSDLVK